MNPTVVNGAATFNQAGSVLTVTNSNGAVINWDKFSIQAGETTHFAQTAASSTVLNRVLNDPTAIYGTLSSNGRVWLVNPAGIMVGPGGRVDTAGFVASTLAIRNEDFLAGRNLFVDQGGAGNVINQGEIKTPSGGSVYLIGKSVSNEGVITTPQGETLLAAGTTISLIDSATPGVKVDITGAEGNSTNLGTITAEAGRIGIAGVIVRNSGMLNASSVVSEGGRIFLKASQDAYVDGNGRIVTTGTKGGSVEVLGNRVAVMDHVSIDASATSDGSDGGSIKVGGDYQGKNSDIQNASITYFGADAELKADAGKVGDGGTVIVWADDTTRAYGRVSARGGEQGGNGGFVETSGHNYLDVDGIKVDASASNGIWGSWLLDPTSLTITDSGGSSIPYGGPTFSSPTDGSTLGWATIAAALTGAITVQTNDGGDIIFQQTTPWTTTNVGSLTFSTTGGISGNWGGTNNSQPSTGLNLKTAGNISFTAGGQVFLGNGTVETTGAAKTISVTSSGGSVGIGLLKAPGNVTVSSKYSIWDNNWQTANGVNIYSNGAISLSSAYGGTDPNSTCTSTSGWCSAIQADIAGVPTSVSATVSSSATRGGIGIRYIGNLPSGFSLTDNSTTPRYNDVDLFATGNIANGFNLSSSYGGMYVGAGGDVTIASETTSGTPAEIAIYAGGTLNVNDSLTSYSGGYYTPLIALAAGTAVNVNGTLTSSGYIGIAAGVSKDQLKQLDNITDVTAKRFADTFTSASGTVTITSAVTAADSVGIVAKDIVVTGSSGSVTATTNDLYAKATNNITLSNGASMVAGRDALLQLLGSASTLYLNPTASASYSWIWAKSPSTIHMNFLSRSSGGIVIDGVETTTSVAGGSGFFVGASKAPATPGSGLQLAYATTIATDLCAINPTLCAPPTTTGTPIDAPPPSFDTSSAGGTPSGSVGDVVGGTEGTFGGEESDTDKEKDEKKDKKSDQAKDEKKDDKPAKKKLAQCTT
ncbi:MAG: filamentous hemagglutinin N-terminal domain-containing protein [Sulfuritalea sp.]|nr:filamentous hemagglutinin N-terminal domain-containing protein [Sulfuritalea sp.]